MMREGTFSDQGSFKPYTSSYVFGGAKCEETPMSVVLRACGHVGCFDSHGGNPNERNYG
jgi:hypothetical protein